MVAVILVPADCKSPIQVIDISCRGRDTTEWSCYYTNSVQEELGRRIFVVLGENADNAIATLLVRPQHDHADGGGSAGLHVYHQQPSGGTKKPKEDSLLPNIRATRLAMACGLFSMRFYGDVVLVRSPYPGGGTCDLTMSDLAAACLVSPDLRASTLDVLSEEMGHGPWTGSCHVSEWLANAANTNYHDEAVVAKFAALLSTTRPSERNDLLYDRDEMTEPAVESHQFVARVSLCLHCRGPASTLCTDCSGVYFCDPPRTCRQDCWSHDCLCRTFRLYTGHRSDLSQFDLGEWCEELTSRDYQLSEKAYESFLEERVGMGRVDRSVGSPSWWWAELGAWQSGDGESPQCVNLTTRQSFMDGFFPIQQIPSDRPISEQDIERAGVGDRNEVGLLRLHSWMDYYQLREIPKSSPVALLLTYPLTLYYAIAEYGQIPCTVARMLCRPLRIHLVGVEKELHFLDLFREVTNLLPSDIAIDLIFVVRQDMLPANAKALNHCCMRISERLSVEIAVGLYGETLDPNFDFQLGPPDMLMAFNAGLFAYPSWRSVLTYLDRSPGVVAVFTDYNEFSGSQCASLGGGLSRQSLQMNPFRQPRAMPVYMNLPQFSNGFMYMFNLKSME